MIVSRCDDRMRHKQCARGRVAAGFPGSSRVAMAVLEYLCSDFLAAAVRRSRADITNYRFLLPALQR